LLHVCIPFYIFVVIWLSEKYPAISQEWSLVRHEWLVSTLTSHFEKSLNSVELFRLRQFTSPISIKPAACYHWSCQSGLQAFGSTGADGVVHGNRLNPLPVMTTIDKHSVCH